MSDISFVVIGSIVVLMAIGFGVHWLQSSVPKPDPDRDIAERWLRENLEDGKWEQVKWFPAQSPRGLQDLNRFHVIENIEKAKKLYENGKGDDCRDACKKLYDNVRDNGLRTFCAMSFRVTALIGHGKVLKRQVWELVDGTAKALPSNEIAELQSAPSANNAVIMGPRYDGWRYFEDKDYNPFNVTVPSDLEERFQAAMIWNEPVKPQAPPASVKPAEPPPQAVAAASASNQKPELNATEQIPPHVRDYFDRVMETKSSEIKTLKKRIDDFESKLRGLKIQQQQVMQDRIRKTEDEIVQLKRAKGTATFPARPAVGDLGAFQFVKVMRIVDDQTLLVRWFINGKGRLPQTDAVVHPVETKNIKVGDEIIGTDFYIITATMDEPTDLLKNVAGTGNAVEFVAEPADKAEAEKWRAQYEREHKDKLPK